MKKCPSCKKNMSDNSAFCDICGTPLENIHNEENHTNPTIPETEPKKKKKKRRPRIEPPKDPTINPQTEPFPVPSATPTTQESEKNQVDNMEPVEEEETVPETTPIVETSYLVQAPTIQTKDFITTPITEPAPTVPIATSPAVTIPVIVTTPVVATPTTIPQTPATALTISTEASPTIGSSVTPEIQPQYQPENYGEQSFTNEEETEEKDSKAVSSIILGITSIILFGMLPLSIIGLVLAYLAKIDVKKRKVGLILNAIAIVYGTICLAVLSNVLSPDNNIIKNTPSNPMENKFIGTGYTLYYGSEWEKTQLSGGLDALKYDGKPAYFSPIGQGKLTEVVSCNFEEAACKTRVYNEFYEYWKKDIDKSFELKKELAFIELKNNIQYATYSYSLNTTGELKGYYYLLVSKDKNFIVSFLTNAEEGYVIALNSKVMELLKTIKIDELEETGDSGNSLSSQSAWNNYPELRANITASKKNFYGEYRILANTNSYWVFKSGEFWWYKDENNLNDNYWYGTMTVSNGKKGIKSLGLSEDKLEEILNQYQGKVTSGDIYSVIMKPSKIISNNEDKTATNLAKGQELRLIWVIVDHKDEGIEAQVLNVDSNEMDYFVKVKD